MKSFQLSKFNSLFRFLTIAAAIAWAYLDETGYGMVIAVFGVAIDSGQGHTESVLPAKRIIEMSNKITMLEPRSAPLTVLLKRLAKSPVGNQKFRWLEDEMIPHIDALFFDTDSAADIGSLTMVNVAYFQAGDIVKNLRTGEHMLVKGITANEINVTRGYGETAAAIVNNSDPIWRIGNVAVEGSDSPASKTTKEVEIFNLCQNFRHSIELTGRLMESNLYGGPHLNRKRKQRGIEHMKEIELAFWFGERKDDTAGKRTTTRGIDAFITTNVTSEATLTEPEFETFLRDGFRYGSSRKWLFASRLFMSGISQWAQGKIRLVPKDKTFGIAITRWISPHGEVMLVPHPLFEGTGGSTKRYSGYAYLLDMDNISYKNFRNRDTKLFTNIQSDKTDGRMDEFRTDAGIKVEQERTHSRIDSVALFA